MNAFMLAKKLSAIYRLAGYYPQAVNKIEATMTSSFGAVRVDEGDWYFQVNKPHPRGLGEEVVGAVIVHKNREISVTGFGYSEGGRELRAVLGG